ncbi:hypothetical protein [Halapricum desulfuricans]|uniref:hypothetical protein n=1 Tax=Halapricum desulfuricans TaxID=2841257 RepID=UPI001E6396BF|nr:hypothetical protein [Halapricum desulfuricans]
MDFDILPWLFHWPPSRRMIAAFLVVTTASVGTIVVLGGVTDTQPDGNITVSDADLSIRLNEETEFPDTNGTVETCLGSGTPGDHLSILGDITVHIPPTHNDNTQSVVLELNHTWNRTVGAIEDRGSVTKDVFWLVEDDETLSVGDTTTVEVHVQEQGTAVASRTLSLPIRNGSRSYDC